MSQKVATTHRRRGGVVVKAVEEASLASDCGIEPGDKILSINGHVIPDSLSYSFNIAMPDLVMVVEKPDGDHWELEIENDPDHSFGLSLEEDPIMLCRNKCVFCFVDQNPKGYRRSLLIKDEDIRLSFMYGNYSTLSSTDRAEEQRIVREKISPLYVSVHATDPETRVFLLKNKKTGNILERLRYFAEHGIQFHAQIVLCPGINDGPILEKTLTDLASLFPACLSIAVVPLGITKHRQKLVELQPVSDAYCAETIAFCDGFREKFKQQLGYPLIFLGDEFYIRAGREIPPAHAYRDFPQMENGIGMVRRFMDGFQGGLDGVHIAPKTHGTLVTGTLFAPVLEQCVNLLNQKFDSRIKVAAIQNDAFGADLINVAGLVHGSDTVSQLSGRDNGDFVVIPHVMLKDPQEDPILIDNMNPRDMAGNLNVPVILSGNTASELLDTLENWQNPERGSKSDASISGSIAV